MTLAEFKAWFEGFTEDMGAAPTAKQWKRIKERVKQIDGTAITKEVIYRDRYWPTIINRPVDPYVTWYSTAIGSSPSLSATHLSAKNSMIDLGKAEYAAVANAS